MIEEQKKRLRQLTDIVRATAQVRESTNEQLVRLPTGDGMALGDKVAALTLAARGLAANPIEILARVASCMGEPDRAITALEKLLLIPYEGALPRGNVPLTPALLRIDPMFDPLRNDPRFQKLLPNQSP